MYFLCALHVTALTSRQQRINLPFVVTYIIYRVGRGNRAQWCTGRNFTCYFEYARQVNSRQREHKNSPKTPIVRLRFSSAFKLNPRETKSSVANHDPVHYKPPINRRFWIGQMTLHTKYRAWAPSDVCIPTTINPRPKQNGTVLSRIPLMNFPEGAIVRLNTSWLSWVVIWSEDDWPESCPTQNRLSSVDHEHW